MSVKGVNKEEYIRQIARREYEICSKCRLPDCNPSVSACKLRGTIKKGRKKK